MFKMAKKNNFWEKNKLDLIPVIGCLVFLGLCAGAYFGIDKYNLKQYQRHQAEKAKMEKQALDTLQQAKDTIAMSAIQQNKKVK